MTKLLYGAVTAPTALHVVVHDGEGDVAADDAQQRRGRGGRGEQRVRHRDGRRGGRPRAKVIAGGPKQPSSLGVIISTMQICLANPPPFQCTFSHFSAQGGAPIFGQWFRTLGGAN